MEEIKLIEDGMKKMSGSVSNLEKCLYMVTKFYRKPLQWWGNASIGERTNLQNLLFPEGIIYEPQLGKFKQKLLNQFLT